MDSTTVKMVVLMVLFFTLNIAFNTYNKFLFTEAPKGEGFNVPLLATMTHSIAGFLCAFALSFFPNVYKRKQLKDWKMTWCVVGISVFFAASIGLNNTSLQFLPLSMHQVIRSTNPAAVAICSVLIDNKHFSWKQIASLVALVGGCALAVFGDMSGSSLLGILLCFGSVFATALQYTFVSITMSPENKLKSFDLLLYTAAPTLLVIFPFFIINGEIEKCSTYVDAKGLDLALGWIFIGQALAVTYNLTVYTFIHFMSAVYLSVCGVFKVILIITFSIVVLGDDIKLVNGIGLVIAMGAFCANSYLEFLAKQAKEKAKEKNDALEADADGKGETEPLLKDDEPQQGNGADEVQTEAGDEA